MLPPRASSGQPAAPPGSTEPAGSFLPPNPFALAQLAALLDPAACASGDAGRIRTALAAATALYVHAQEYHDENRPLTLPQYILNSDAPLPLQEWYLQRAGRPQDAAAETRKLRLHESPVSAEPDEACRFLGWKNCRRRPVAVPGPVRFGLRDAPVVCLA